MSRKVVDGIGVAAIASILFFSGAFSAKGLCTASMSAARGEVVTQKADSPVGRWQIVNLGRYGESDVFADALLVDTTTGNAFRLVDLGGALVHVRANALPEDVDKLDEYAKKLPAACWKAVRPYVTGERLPWVSLDSHAGRIETRSSRHAARVA